jgi:hypothetical protein
MARRGDPLEDAKLGNDGEPLAENAAKDTARKLIAEATAALPKGVPASSPYAGYGRDALISEAVRMSISVGALMEDPDLRLVCEHARLRIARANAPAKLPVQAPVEEQRVVPVKIRGLKDSPTNRWRVVESRMPEHIPYVSLGDGQMWKPRNGAILELRHYSKQRLQSLVDQNVKLVPVEELDEEE